ncbi:MAG: hypothetical protein ACLQVI_33600 [Polyangiaceae bacterium]|jgi:hypothetical protein
MADDKKPKIDLKARLGKQGGAAAAPAPTPMPGGVVPQATRSQPPPMVGSPQAPPGVPVGPPPRFAPASQAPMDPSNPLAAVATPYRPPPMQQQAPAPVATRIEVDEGVVHEARRGALKRGMVIGLIIAAALGGVGFVAGGASEQGKAREKSKGDAASLSEDLTKAKDTLTKLADKMEEGVKTLSGGKFPDKLSGDLGGLNVAFDGSELAGRRFSGFPQETTAMLVDFITSVQALNDRKELVQGLLTKLQKPMTDQMNAPPGSGSITLIAAVQKDATGNPYAFLAPLSPAITFTSSSDIKWPPQFTFSDPMGGGSNASAPRYTGGDISKAAAAIPVVGKTFEKVCPSEAAGGVAQLRAQIGGFIRDIRGEGAAAPDVVTDTKAGLIERADKLLLGLQKVQ